MREFSLAEYPCCICGQTSKKPIRNKQGALTQTVFRFVSCVNCGHVFVDPRIRDEDLHGLYDESYYRGAGFDPSINYWADHPLSKIAEVSRVIDTVSEVFGGSLTQLRWLDFGCGAGHLLQELSKLNVRAVGHDDSPCAIDICKRKGLELLSKSDLESLEGSFDVITALEVIEHVPDPISFIRSLRRMLSAHGVLLIQTGNWNLVSRARGTPYLMPEGHINYFAPPELRSILQNLGFDELKVLNRSWIGYRLVPEFMRSRPLFLRLLAQLESVVRRFLPSLAQNPVVRIRAEPIC